MNWFVKWLLIKKLKGVTKMLQGKKTFLLSIVAVVYAVSAALLGHITWNEAIQIILGSGVAATLRDAIAKK